MTVVYVGIRTRAWCHVWRVGDDGKWRPLRASKRSPHFPSSQWEWGYGGTGPADLAWSLVFDATADREQTDTVFQRVKWAVVSRLNKAHWILSAEELQEAIDAAGKEALAAEGEPVIDLSLAVPSDPPTITQPQRPDTQEA
jgi:hypothetical protein